MIKTWQAEIRELRAELDEQCRLNGMGAEREYVLIGKIDRLRVDLARATFERNKTCKDRQPHFAATAEGR